MDTALEITERGLTSAELREWMSGGQLYALVDACDAIEVAVRARALGPEIALCLYGGRAADEYAAVAPYIFKVDASILDWIETTQYGTPWGIWVVAEASLEALRRHFLQFVTVRDPDGNRVYFRFYDPRVCEAYLSECLESELSAFFGPVRAVAMERVEIGELTMLELHR